MGYVGHLAGARAVGTRGIRPSGVQRAKVGVLPLISKHVHYIKTKRALILILYGFTLCGPRELEV